MQWQSKSFYRISGMRSQVPALAWLLCHCRSPHFYWRLRQHAHVHFYDTFYVASTSSPRAERLVQLFERYPNIRPQTFFDYAFYRQVADEFINTDRCIGQSEMSGSAGTGAEPVRSARRSRNGRFMEPFSEIRCPMTSVSVDDSSATCGRKA